VLETTCNCFFHRRQNGGSQQYQIRMSSAMKWLVLVNSTPNASHLAKSEHVIRHFEPRNNFRGGNQNGYDGQMMERVMGKMSNEEKQNMMEKMMEKFFADMTPEDKQKMMEGVNMIEVMPRMMMSMMGGGKGESGMMEMMSQMMGGGKKGEMSMMPQMMTEMMPQCLRVMLPNMPKEKRIDFVLKMVTTLVEQGAAGMSEEKKDFVAKLVEKVKT
jgi:hypothetical protein